MSSEPEILVEDDAGSLARATATRVLDVLGAALAARPVAHLVVTGGGILEAVLAELRTATDRTPLDWSRVHIWWGDERYVASDSDDRNDLPARAKAFDHLDVDPAKVHPMPASDAGFGEDLEAAADSYAAELRAAAPARYPDEDVPRFDVVLLGLGPDGHCASLFPNQPGPLVTDVPVIGVRNSPKPPPNRISLTMPALDAAEQVWFIAAGDGKADAVAKALGGAPPAEVPSAGPRGRQRTLWLIDRAAAGQLPG